MNDSAPPRQVGSPEAETPPHPGRVLRRARVLISLASRAVLEHESEEEIASRIHEKTMEWMAFHKLWEEAEPQERELLETPLHQIRDGRALAQASWECEGAAVLAWALRKFALPAYDVPVFVEDVGEALGFLSLAPVEVVPRLRNSDELTRFAHAMEALSWRLRQHHLDRTQHLDLHQAGSVPSGVDALNLINGDLALGDREICEVGEEDLVRYTGIACERRKAVGWLLGQRPRYSEVAPAP